MKRIILFAIMIAFATSSFGQKIKVADGKYKALKGVKKLNYYGLQVHRFKATD